MSAGDLFTLFLYSLITIALKLYVIKIVNNNNYYFVDCEKLIRHMLVVEPERRLSIRQILAHPWMGGDGVTEPEPGGYLFIIYEIDI